MYQAVNIREGVHKRGSKTAMTCPAVTDSVHVVMSDGKIKRCQLGITRSFPFLDIQWITDQDGEIHGIRSVAIRGSFERAGWTLLSADYKAEGNEDGYARYCNWERQADRLRAISAEQKGQRIPDITPYLPKSVLERREAAKIPNAAAFGLVDPDDEGAGKGKSRRGKKPTDTAAALEGGA